VVSMSRTSRGCLAVVLAVLCLAADDGSKLRKAVERGNLAWVQAGRTLDPGVLAPYFSGAALKELSEILASTREDGVYMELKLVDVKYRDVALESDGKHGSVAVSEFWRVTFRHIGTDECDTILKPRERRQTYRLESSGLGWRIIAIEEEPNLPKLETEECPS
jgi:hypothetical protein